ncbi:sensor domain-containing diguanylate cyclase [Massilia sp. TS11]|uniref:sensor domain-containing diguanylate cyclase n=1 Tax=Massilia sp. TS11 TaxID=2908003 RepID=UPI001EDB9346|nr:sensor domain-containing diguanylate cyclase [Massilia sp. TS11]MCG2585685.1 sensor domain-containing diguanylate cyclase [Massilia sp. TS11]
MSDPRAPSPAPLAEVASLRSVLDSVGAYIFTKDLQGRYTFVNALVCELLGQPAEAVLGRDDSLFFDLERSQTLRENDRRVLELGETIANEEVNVVKGSGEVRIYWSVKQPIRDADGRIIGMSGIATDITERKRLERELQAQREMLTTVLDHTEAAVYMKDREGHYLYVNDKTAAVFGLPKDDILGRRDSELLEPSQAAAVRAMDLQLFTTREKQCGEETMPGPQGSRRHFWTIKVPLSRESSGDTLVGISTDITEMQVLKEELQRQAYTDMLTGVSNRRHFFQEAAKEFSKARRYRLALSAIVLDLDHFKQINDRYGHQAGDAVLVELAQHCVRTVRDCDLFGRLGGEEFAFVLPSTQLDAAYILAERLRTSLTGMLIKGDWPGAIAPTASFGVAMLNPQDRDIAALLARADKALYQAKEGGRNRVCIASDAYS